MQGHRHLDLGSKLSGQSVPTLHSLSRAVSRSSRLRVHAELSAKGKRHNAEAITVKRIMGEGSYGQVPTFLRYSCSIVACLPQTAQVAAEAALPPIFTKALDRA